MHTIMEKEFTLGDFSIEKVSDGLLVGVEAIVNALNTLRDLYINYDKYENSETSKQELWNSVIQLLPSSYNQTRNVMLNYEVLANIYKSRKNHKLDEWRKFCEWIEMLPWSELICDWDMDEKPKEKVENFNEKMNPPETDSKIANDKGLHEAVKNALVETFAEMDKED